MHIITIASNKGGQGKTTTAIHLAAFFHKLSPTLLVDGDGIRTATKYQARGKGLAFKIVSDREMPKYLRDFETVIIDTEANPSDEDFEGLAAGCDLLVIPAVPKTCDIDGLTSTLARLHRLGNSRFKVLITMAPPSPQTDAAQLREKLRELSIPAFRQDVPYLKTFDRASSMGVPVYDVKDTEERIRRSWGPYESAGREIVDGKI